MKRGCLLRRQESIRIIAIVLCLVAGFSACKKEKKEPADVVAKNYFTIQNADFVTATFPKVSGGGAPSISSISGNTQVLEGGSNPITITTSSTVKEVLVGVQGKSGYYKISSGNLKATTVTYMIYLLFSSDFVADGFTILIAIVDANGLISEPETIEVTRIVAGTGKLQVNCSWDQPNDLDLHLVEPNLTEIYWDQDTSKNGGILDVDSNPICYIDGINSENITYSGNATTEKGKYTIRISLFKSCNVTDLTHYVVTARLDGALLTPTSGTNPYYGTVTAAEAYIDGTGPHEGVTVMEFNVAAIKSASAGNQKMLKFSYHKKPNLLKREIAASKE